MLREMETDEMLNKYLFGMGRNVIFELNLSNVSNEKEKKISWPKSEKFSTDESFDFPFSKWRWKRKCWLIQNTTKKNRKKTFSTYIWITIIAPFSEILGQFFHGAIFWTKLLLHIKFQVARLTVNENHNILHNFDGIMLSFYDAWKLKSTNIAIFERRAFSTSSPTSWRKFRFFSYFATLAVYRFLRLNSKPFFLFAPFHIAFVQKVVKIHLLHHESRFCWSKYTLPLSLSSFSFLSKWREQKTKHNIYVF